MSEARSRAARLMLPLALVVAAVLLFAPLPDRWTRGWKVTFLDFGHVPLFGVLMLLAARPDRSLLWPALFVIALAGLTELIQGQVGRTADWGDFFRGTLGALAATAALLAWRRRRQPKLAIGAGLLAVALLAWPVFEAAPRLIDASEGSPQFPPMAGVLI